MISKTIKITIQGPMPDTDNEPGIWVADVRVMDCSSNDAREQSWKSDDLDKILQAMPEIINRMMPINSKPT